MDNLPGEDGSTQILVETGMRFFSFPRYLRGFKVGGVVYIGNIPHCAAMARKASTYRG